MNQMTIIITAICIFGSIMIANLPLWMYVKFQYNRKTLKPFDCSYCLSGWSSMIVSFLCGYYWYEVIAFMTITPFLTAIIESLLNRMRSL